MSGGGDDDLSVDLGALTGIDTISNTWERIKKNPLDIVGHATGSINDSLITPLKETGKLVGEVTGTNATVRQMRAQAEAAAKQAESDRTLANAAAQNTQQDQTKIALNTGRRRRNQSGGNSGNSFGSSLQINKGTGVQS